MRLSPWSDRLKVLIGVGEPVDRLLADARRKGARRLLVAWIRGLGDIPLRLCGFVQHLRERVPEASVSFITRSGLQEGFLLMPGVEEVLVVPEWRREDHLHGRPSLGEIHEALKRLGREGDFDLIIPRVDRGRWWERQVGCFVPRLLWRPDYATFGRKVVQEACGDPNKLCLAVHLQAGTRHFYQGGGRNKDWPRERWLALFERITANLPASIFLLGGAGCSSYEVPFTQAQGFHDLRGRTSVVEALSVIKACDVFIAPDSGLLSLVYYLETATPLQAISLYGEVAGVLRQGVASPNPLLVHHPIVEESGRIEEIPVESVFRTLESIGGRLLLAKQRMG